MIKTLDEAIKHYEEKAEEERERIITVLDDGREIYNPEYEEYAEQYEQLAEWLEKLDEARKIIWDTSLEDACKIMKLRNLIDYDLDKTHTNAPTVEPERDYSQGWHDAITKALNEAYTITTEDGSFKVVQTETLEGLGMSMPMPERPKGDLISRKALKEEMKIAHAEAIDYETVVDMYEKLVDNAPTVDKGYDFGYADGHGEGYELGKTSRPQGECEKCDFRKFAETFVDAIVEVMNKKGITSLEQLSEILKGGAE